MLNLEKISPILFLLMWSSGAIFVKMGLEDASVWSFLTLRVTGAFVLITIISIFWRGSQFTSLASLQRPSLMKLLLSGFLLQVCYQGSYFLAINYQLSPGIVAMVLGLQPLLTPFLSKEHVSLKSYLTLILGFAGLIIAVYGARDISQITFLGLLFAVAAVLAITTGSVYQKQIQVHPIASALIQNAFAACIFLVISLSVGWEVNWTTQFIISAAWMIGVVSTGAILLLLYMLTKNSASSVSVLFYLVPILTMAFDYMAFGTTITVTTVFGAGMVIGSIYLFRQPTMAPKLTKIN